MLSNATRLSSRLTFRGVLYACEIMLADRCSNVKYMRRLTYDVKFVKPYGKNR